MQNISAQELRDVKIDPKIETPKEALDIELSIEKALELMDNPLEAQKAIAAKIHLDLLRRIDREEKSLTGLSSDTRKWIDTYNATCEKLMRAINGERGFDAQIIVVTHGQIAAKARENFKKVIDITPANEE